MSYLIGKQCKYYVYEDCKGKGVYCETVVVGEEVAALLMLEDGTLTTIGIEYLIF